jgi:hypothetical protein
MQGIFAPAAPAHHAAVKANAAALAANTARAIIVKADLQELISHRWRLSRDAGTPAV